MGAINLPSRVLLFTAAFGTDEAVFSWSRRRMEELYGPIELESETFRFDKFTSYYAPSMGSVLPKRLWAFRRLIDPSELARIKRLTNALEDEFRAIHADLYSMARPLNLDPGYVDLGKLILASTKDHAHRIYLSDGIFAETTLMYTQKHWKSIPWTYPDYQSEDYQTFLTRCRDYLKTKNDKLKTKNE